MTHDVQFTAKVIDMHCHVGLLGDEFPHWGKMSDWYTRQLVFKVFLLFGRVDPDEVSDRTLREGTEKAISETTLDHVVCLALDPVYDNNGERREDLSHLWVDNDYVLDLQRTIGDKVLFGASVHPYDTQFKERVRLYIDKGAVFLKWLPSAQQIDLADGRVKDALIFLGTARQGSPLPLLLHVGPEYAIPSTDPRTSSYDFLTWTWWDRFRNVFRGSEKWHPPQEKKIAYNLRAGLGAGAVIILAHCGLPYYAPNWLKGVFEHSELKMVSRYLNEFPAAPSVGGSRQTGGRCYADVSACATPFRRSYYSDIMKLPPQSLLFGSDFPTPVFELSADLSENVEDFQAIMNGELDRIIIPEDNLMDVNYRELRHFFPDHPMFTNFNAILHNL